MQRTDPLTRATATTIAVVIPAYNAGATLAHCLRSVFAQTLPPLEIIIVDDGSSDDTDAVARSFGDAVTVVNQPNQGSAVARQAGSELATAEYIAYLDADDWWPEARLETCAEILNMDDVHFLMTDFVRAEPGAAPGEYLAQNTEYFPRFVAKLEHRGERLARPQLFRLAQEDALGSMLDGFPCFPSASVLRRTSLLGAGGWDRRFRRCQDFDMALKMTRRFPLHFLNEILAIVGINKGNENAKRYVIQQTSGNIQVLETHYRESVAEPAYRKQVALTLAHRYYSLGNTYRGAGRKREAAAAYRTAARWPGKRMKSLVWMIQAYR
jgi:glycosyltransferase involved in cell wall biosynthesis